MHVILSCLPQVTVLETDVVSPDIAVKDEAGLPNSVKTVL
jgi:hypothetical protein